jgi:ABC-type multidrug transport system fused ATPase/permease subunit
MKLFLKQVLHLLDQDKKKLPLMVIIFLISSVFDLIGIGLIGPYIALLADVDVFSGVVGNLVYFLGLPEEKEALLITISYILLSVFIVKTIFSIWINKIIVQFSERQHVRLISFLMSSYQSLPYIEYIKRNSSEYVYSIHQLSNQYANHVVSPLLRMASDGIVVTAIIIFLAQQSPEALTLLVGLLAIVMFLYNSIFRKRMSYYGEQCNLVSAAIMQEVSEGMEGLKEIRILGKEQYFYNNVKKESDMLAFFAVKSSVLSMSLRYLLELTMMVFVIFLVLGALFLDRSEDLLLPTLSVFGVAALRLFPAVNTFMQSLMQMHYGRNSVSTLFNDVTDIKESVKIHINTSQPMQVNEEFQTLSLNQVCFFYPDSKHNALDDISLKIHVGESIGFIGPSGSGKTTLLDTLLGLLEPQKGCIEFNGRNIKNNLKEWQSKVAYIPQQVFLIDGSLRENVALGLNENEIDEDKLLESLRQARLMDLVEKLPQGVNTILGERGIRFSGGQRQRVALARAFYHGRNILVMDEATSALDNATEKEIVTEIERLKGEKTTIVIAHRLTTLKHCDRIYKLQDGKIVNMGSYGEIIEAEQQS